MPARRTCHVDLYAQAHRFPRVSMSSHLAPFFLVLPQSALKMSLCVSPHLFSFIACLSSMSPLLSRSPSPVSLPQIGLPLSYEKRVCKRLLETCVLTEAIFVNRLQLKGELLQEAKRW